MKRYPCSLTHCSSGVRKGSSTEHVLFPQEEKWGRGEGVSGGFPPALLVL
jgi:hypothetical protein